MEFAFTKKDFRDEVEDKGYAAVHSMEDTDVSDLEALYSTGSYDALDTIHRYLTDEFEDEKSEIKDKILRFVELLKK